MLIQFAFVVLDDVLGLRIVRDNPPCILRLAGIPHMLYVVGHGMRVCNMDAWQWPHSR